MEPSIAGTILLDHDFLTFVFDHTRLFVPVTGR